MPSDPKPGPKFKVLPVPESVYWKAPVACRSCGKDMWFWLNPKTGKRVPVNADRTSHFTTCNDPGRFSKQRVRKETVIRCSSCGENHKDLEFRKTGPLWKGSCPTTGIDLFMSDTEGGKDEEG